MSNDFIFWRRLGLRHKHCFELQILGFNRRMRKQWRLDDSMLCWSLFWKRLGLRHKHCFELQILGFNRRMRKQSRLDDSMLRWRLFQNFWLSIYVKQILNWNFIIFEWVSEGILVLIFEVRSKGCLISPGGAQGVSHKSGRSTKRNECQTCTIKGKEQVSIQA